MVAANPKAHARGMASPRLHIGRHSCIGASYVVTTVTRDRNPLLACDKHAQLLVEQLKALEREGSVESLAWGLMPDHVHWLFTLRSTSLACVVQRLKARSAHAIATYIGKTGGIWQRGYYDHQIRSDSDLREQMLYLLANPIRARFVHDLADYPYWLSMGRVAA